jgi:iron complex outermembrane receptor protein
MMSLWELFSMKSIFRAIVILCLSGTLVAQTGFITGMVLDGSTGLGLVGANVTLSGTNYGTATDLEGSFILSVPVESYTLTVTMIGYTAFSMPAQAGLLSSAEIHIKLPAMVIDSKQFITVQGERTDNPIFTHHQETNMSTTESLLSLIEGVNLITRGSYAQEPIIRGMSGGRVNITIDGMKSFGACTDHMDPISSYVEADAMNSVEVSKGAQSILQGSTVGGSVNMTFVKPQYSLTSKSLWQIKSGFDSGSQERKISFSGQRQNQNAALSINGAYRKAENYSDAQGAEIPFSGFEKMNLNLGYKRRLNEKTQLYFEMITDDAYDIGYAALPMDVGYARMRMLGISINSANVTPNLLKLEWKIYGNAVDHWMDDSNREILFMNMHMEMPGFTRTAGTYLDLILGRNQHSLLKFRTECYWTSSYADMIMYPVNSSSMKMVTWPGVNRMNFGQFAEYQSMLNSRINLNASVRYDYHQSTATDEMGIKELHIYYPENDLTRRDHLISANTFLAFEVNRRFRSVVALALGSRIPDVSEAYGYYLYTPVDGYLYLGNPELPIEKSRQVEWQNTLHSESTQLDLTLYHYKFNNYIFGQIMPGASLGYANGWKKYVNAGQATTTGVELSLLQQLSTQLIFQGGLNYQLGELVDLNDALPFIPPLEAHASIKYDRGPLWIQFGAKGAMEQKNISELSGENMTPTYLVMNLKAEYVLRGGLKLNASVTNLTNQLYHDHLDWGDIYRSGRSGQLSITIDQSLLE